MAQANTSVLLSALRGKAGSVVFVQTKYGVTVRPRTTPHNPQTPAQTATRTAMMKASRLFSSLDPQTVRTWNTYAQTLKTFDEATGRVRCPSGQNVFAGYCCKLWQMDDEADVPLSPPVSAFLGDGITVSVSANSTGITFTASGANAANVVTELLIQPLKSGARTPLRRDYRSAGFVGFSHTFPHSLVEAPAGWVAVAVRFVREDTGQQSALLELGLVQVGESAGTDGPVPPENPLPCCAGFPLKGEEGRQLRPRHRLSPPFRGAGGSPAMPEKRGVGPPYPPSSGWP